MDSKISVNQKLFTFDDNMVLMMTKLDVKQIPKTTQALKDAQDG